MPSNSFASLGLVWQNKEEGGQMSTENRLIVILSIGALLVFGGIFGCQKGKRAEDFEWIAIDENYVPQNYVEEFIKKDSEEKGLLPVYIRNYGQDGSILRKFRGSNFAFPKPAQVEMMYKNLQDWMLVDLKYKNERDQEVQRTILYVQVEGSWRVGDSGRLVE